METDLQCSGLTVDNYYTRTVAKQKYKNSKIRAIGVEINIITIGRCSTSIKTYRVSRKRVFPPFRWLPKLNILFQILCELFLNDVYFFYEHFCIEMFFDLHLFSGSKCLTDGPLKFGGVKISIFHDTNLQLKYKQLIISKL